MAMAMPIAIGTRGTVGALVRKEIEFFAQRREAERPRAKAGRRPRLHAVHGNWGGLLQVGTYWRRKKQRGAARGFLPSLCNAVQVVEIGIPGFGYTPLRDDAEA